MVVIRSTLFIADVICGVSGSAGCNDAPTIPTKNRPPLPAAPEITILSGTKFRCDGASCELLGVNESADPAIREQAHKFTQARFKSIGNFIGFDNNSNPLVSEDGTKNVWVRGLDLYLSCLNEELIRTGLAEVDEAHWLSYTFTVPTKGPKDKIEDWRDILQRAKEGHKKGEKPRVLFNWSPA